MVQGLESGAGAEQTKFRVPFWYLGRSHVKLACENICQRFEQNYAQCLPKHTHMRTRQTLQNFNLKFSTSPVRVCGQKVWLPGKIFAKNEKLCKKQIKKKRRRKKVRTKRGAGERKKKLCANIN